MFAKILGRISMRLKLHIKILVAFGAIMLFSTFFVNADEVDSQEQDVANNVSSGQNIEVSDEYNNQGNVVQVQTSETETISSYHSNAKPVSLSVQRAPRYNSWIDENGNRYYADGNGNYVRGIHEINGVIYFFDPSTGALKREAGWRTWGNGRYFTNGEGIAYRSRFITFGTPKFYMGIDGAVKTGIFSTLDGQLYNADDYTGEVIQVAQWIEKNGKKYFSNASGELYKNQFISFGNTYYYMGSDGAVVVGSFYYNGENYSSNSEGIVNELTGPVGSSVLGIDVSYAQGVIDWNKVANAGIKFAIIRAAFRGYGTGRIVADEWFERNIKGATAAGIKVGVYFFSQAINETEGAEEADYIINQIKHYKVTLPVVIDTEYVSDSRARGNSISKTTRTAAVKAFCERSLQRGYTPMIYASTSWLNNQLDMSKLSSYKVWVAQYYNRVTYTGKYQCWQYTSSGHVDGINTKVDMNYWYI